MTPYETVRPYGIFLQSGGSSGSEFDVIIPDGGILTPSNQALYKADVYCSGNVIIEGGTINIPGKLIIVGNAILNSNGLQLLLTVGADLIVGNLTDISTSGDINLQPSEDIDATYLIVGGNICVMQSLNLSAFPDASVHISGGLLNVLGDCLVIGNSSNPNITTRGLIATGSSNSSLPDDSSAVCSGGQIYISGDLFLSSTTYDGISIGVFLNGYKYGDGGIIAVNGGILQSYTGVIHQ